MADYGQGVLSRLFASPVGIALLVLALIVEVAGPVVVLKYAPEKRRELYRLIVRVAGLGLMLLAFALVVNAQG